MSDEARVMEPVRLERHGPIAVIVVDHPPVNALSHPVRAGLLGAILEADADRGIAAIVVHGAGKNFIAGADIRELEQTPRAPLLNDVLMRLESCSKPVVAALHGAVLGGGLETALACHYRCATPDARLGLPEVKLGLLPGAGGTQRLPRLIGAKRALEMMVSGEPIGREEALALGLVDRPLPEGDPLAGAMEHARELVAQGAPPRRVREKPLPEPLPDEKFFAEFRRSLPRSARRSAAVDRIVQCVEAARSLAFEEGLALSRQLFEECRASDESAALRHLFFAERSASRSGGGSPREVRSVCVVGAGTMGSGIAAACAMHGLQLALVDREQGALESGMARLRSAVESAAKRGRLDEGGAAAVLERVTTARNLDAARDADLVIEAVYENLALKQEVFRQLDGICRPGTVLATNTSTLDVDAIASATRRPQDVLGMHFFSPAHVMRLLEIVRGRATSPDSLATALAVGKRIGKLGVVVGNCFGFVGNRMLYAYGRENQLMMLEGVPPERIDAVLEEWGMAMGPNAVGDLAGLDVGYRVRRERRDLPDDPRYFRVFDLLAELGRYGRKTGRGVYLYEGEKRERRPDPEVRELIRAEAARLGVAQREVSDAEIVERCIYALINEGARILEEGIASTAADIDVIWCNGYGFPRTRGGPMFHADRLGLTTVLDGIRRFAREQGERYWQPAPLLVRLAAEGKTFGAWRRAADAAD